MQKTAPVFTIFFLLILLPARVPHADQIASLRKIAPDTIPLPPFTPIAGLTGETLFDSAFINHVDTTLRQCKSIRDAYGKFKKFLPQAEKKRLTARVFASFYHSCAAGTLRKDTAGYRWYCKKWRSDALAARSDFMRTCYSDCFYEDGAFGPSATPVIDTWAPGSDTAIRAGLFLRDRKSRIKYTYELSRLTCDIRAHRYGFIRVQKKSFHADSANWSTRIPIGGGDVFRLTIYTKDNFRVFYLRSGSLHAFAQCDNRTLLVHGYSPSNTLPPPYTVYVLSGNAFIQSVTDSAGVCALSFRDFPDSLIDARIYVEKNGIIAPIEVSRRVVDERNKIGSYVYSDRTWYRPGDTVHIGGMVKNFTEAARFSKSAVDSVRLELSTSFTKKTTVTAVPLDTMGHFFDSLVLPSNAKLESYRVRVLLPLKTKGIVPENTETEFDVAIYKKPSCRVSVSTDKALYYPADTIEEKIAVSYFLGALVRYASGSLYGFYAPYTLDTMLEDPLRPRYRYRKGRESMAPVIPLTICDTVCDKNGALLFRLPVDSLHNNGFYTLQASFQGQDKRFYGGSRKIFVAADTPLVNIFTRTVPSGDSADLFISCFVTDPEGFPCSAAVACSLSCDDTASGSMQKETVTEKGAARFDFRGLRPDTSYRATCIVHPSRPDAKRITVEIGAPRGSRLEDDNDGHLFTDRTVYRHGDTVIATVHFPGLDSVPVLFTAGSTGMQYYRAALSGRPAVFSIPLSPDMGSVVFLSAACFDGESESLLTSHKQITIGPDSALLLDVSLNSPRRVNPGDICNLDLSVVDRTGKPAKAAFSAAVVDEAVFAIRPEGDSGMLHSLASVTYRFPCSTFCSTQPTEARESIRSVESFDGLTLLTGKRSRPVTLKFRFGRGQLFFTEDLRSEWDGIMCTSMDSGGTIDDLIGGLMGGDGGALELKKRGALRIPAPDFMKGGSKPGRPTPIRHYFRDQACWISSVKTAPDGRASFSFRLPDNLTQWRIRLRGSDGGSRLVDFRDSLIANKPLMIQLETPRFLIVNDSTTVHAVIFNNTERAIAARVGLEANAGVRVHGETARNVSVEPNGTAVVEWPMTALGGDTIVLIAKAKSPDAGDGEQRKLPVQPYALEMRTGASALVRDSCSIRLDLPPEAIPGSLRMEIHAAHDKITALLPALNYLMEFPHGCVEQTMNRFLPDLYVADILAKYNIKNPELESKFKKCLQQGLTRLEGYQHGDGGWGWWENDRTDERMTALVVRGLYFALQTPIDPEARKRIAAMLGKGVPRLVAMIDSRGSDAVSALPMLNSLARSPHLERKRNCVEALARDAGRLTIGQRADLLECTHALRLTNRDSLLIGSMEQSARQVPGMMWWPAEKIGGNGGSWDESAVYVTATALSAIATARPDHPSVAPVLRWLFSKNDGQKWISTATTAEVVRAIGNCYSPSDSSTAAPATLKAVINGVPYQLPVAAGLLRAGPDRGFAVSDSSLRQTNAASFYSQTGIPVFCLAAIRYSARIPPAPDSQSSVRIKRTYYRVDRIDGEVKKLPLEGQCCGGDEIEACLELDAEAPCRYLMVEEPLPAGMEMIVPEGAAPPAGVTHAEYLPEKILFYLETLPGGVTKVTYALRAVFPGVYRVLPARAEAMYVPELHGRSRGEEIKIRR